MKVPGSTVQVSKDASLCQRQWWKFAVLSVCAFPVDGCDPIDSAVSMPRAIPIVGQLIPHRILPREIIPFGVLSREHMQVAPSNNAREELINLSKAIVNKAKTYGRELDASMIFELAGWVLKNDPELTEDEQVENIKGQIEKLKSQFIVFDEELNKLEEVMPRFRKEVLKPPAKEEGKFEVGELLLNNAVFTTAKQLATAAQMTGEESLDFIAFFLTETEKSKIIKAIDNSVSTAKTSRAKEGNPVDTKKVDALIVKLKERIDLYLRNRKKDT